MSENQPKIAVVGAGYWGRNLVRNFAATGTLKWVCDRNKDILAGLNGPYPALKLTDSFSELLEDRDLDAVAIASPAELHYRMATEVLASGKHVFVEKPLALRHEEGEELLKLALAGGRVLMVGHLLQYHPAVVKLKQLVSEGELGKIQYMYSNRLNLGKIRREENILWSFAPHDISILLSLAQEMPDHVISTGANYLHPNLADVTLSSLSFPSGVKAHIFVSWLHPYKEQRLVVVGDRKMALFNDLEPKDKLLLYPHRIEWRDQIPVPDRKDAETVPLEDREPLLEECRHFVECIREGRTPTTDGREALRVLRVLEACQRSLEQGGTPASLGKEGVPNRGPEVQVHETAVVDAGCEIGRGTKIWHFSHVLSGSRIGRNCSIGQNVVIGPDVKVGEGVKIQNNVSIYKGVTIENGVFCGPSMVFTNVYNPRSHIRRMDEIRPTLVREGATLGANCTVVCGNTIGRYAFVGAGAVVLKEVPDFSLVAGNPAKVRGWMCRCGIRLQFDGGMATCGGCGESYLMSGGRVREVIPDGPGRPGRGGEAETG
jgi:UDP-2-acetamido-3-amino-2,3-dideoxy-glucuronate N-acetyltransferase